MGNVSIESDGIYEGSDTDNSVDISLYEASVKSKPPLVGPVHRSSRLANVESDLEVESLTSRTTGRGGGQMEPLMSAHIRPAKEKSNNQGSKDMESGNTRLAQFTILV